MPTESEKIDRSKELAKRYGSIALSGLSTVIHQQKVKGVDELSDFSMDELRRYASLIDFIIKSSLLASGKGFMEKHLKHEENVLNIFEDYADRIRKLDQDAVSSFMAYAREAFDTNFLTPLHWR